MKKTLKLILCLMMSVLLILSFTACNNDNAAPEADNSANESEEVVTSFLDAWFELNLADATEYLTEAGELPFEDSEGAKAIMLDEIATDPSLAPYVDKFEPIADLVLGRLIEGFDYEIADVKDGKDEYTYEIEVTSYDFETLNGTFENLDIDSEALGEEILNELMTSGEITEASTEEEIMDLFMVAMIDEMVTILEDAIEDADTTTTTIELVVTKDGSQWLIDADASDISELQEMME